MKNDKIKLIKPYNVTDPIVCHDPKIKHTPVIKLYTPALKHDANTTSPGDELEDPVSLKRVDGIKIPIVKLNNKVINSGTILDLTINYTDFYPSLILTVSDYEDNIKTTDVPGMNNKITIIFIPSVDGIYKKISLDFYITHYEDNDRELTYYADYNCFSLLQDRLTAVTFTGCTACKKMQKQFKPNTWEFLHEIAVQTGLGFAATEHCKDIEDRLNRLIRNKSYYEAIQENILYSGLDENSIFDTWIDLYGYIVMVNLAYIFNEDVNPNSLTINAIKGLVPTAENTHEQQIELVHRTLTNYNKSGTISNLEIESFKDIINNDAVNSGTLQTIQIFNLTGVTETSNNTIDTEQIQVKENSVDGEHTEDYEIETKTPVMINFNDYSVTKQEIIRTSFLSKYRSKMTVIKMRQPNFGLQRGTLVNVILFADSINNKQIILNNTSNINGENNDMTVEKSTDEKTDNDNIFNKQDMDVPDISRNGLYYIDGMKFEYESGDDNIAQYLYLIKKGTHTNYTNKYTAPKLKLNND